MFKPSRSSKMTSTFPPDLPESIIQALDTFSGFDNDASSNLLVDRNQHTGAPPVPLHLPKTIEPLRHLLLFFRFGYHASNYQYLMLSQQYGFNFMPRDPNLSDKIIGTEATVV